MIKTLRCWLARVTGIAWLHVEVISAPWGGVRYCRHCGRLI